MAGQAENWTIIIFIFSFDYLFDELVFFLQSFCLNEMTACEYSLGTDEFTETSSLFIVRIGSNPYMISLVHFC